jgi:hypothetical protein
MMKALLKGMASAFALTALAAIASAQVIEKKTLSLDGARSVIEAAKSEAKRLGAPGGVIAVVDEGWQLDGARTPRRHIRRRREHLDREGAHRRLVQTTDQSI